MNLSGIKFILHQCSRLVLIFVLVGNCGCLENVKPNDLLQDAKPQTTVSEDVHVQFLTRLRHKRHIHRNDFHILQVQQAAKNLTFQIHLTKSNHISTSDLKPIVRYGNSKRKHLFGNSKWLCNFAGVVSGDIVGKAVFSACGSTPGFSGVIFADSMMYSMEPKGSFPSGYENANNGIAHVLTSMDNSEFEESHTCASASESMDFVSADIKDSYGGEETLTQFDAGAEQRRAAVEIGKSKKSMSFLQNMSPRQYSDGLSSRTIELAIFADQSLIEYLFNKLNTTSLPEIQGYVHVLTHIMAINFNHPSLEERINFRIVHEELWLKNPPGFTTSNGTYLKFLETFCSYAFSQNAPSGGKNWDHAMLLTASDLTNAYRNMSYGGVAYLSGSCTDRSSCSLVRAKTFNAASTMTHEIGHSLGMNHDGQDENQNCPPTGYFMSGTSGSGRVSWSSCSNKNVRDFFKFLGGVNEKYGYTFGRKYRKNCLHTFTSNAKSFTAFSSSKLPGEEFPPSFQCLFASQNFPEVVNLNKANFCKKLNCATKDRETTWEIHAPLEGSECDEGKWCLQGECVSKTKRKPNLETAV